MISWVKRKVLKSKFNRDFVCVNKYTKRAFNLKTDKDFKKLCWECIGDIAGENKKDIKAVSLEDIYRVLDKIRKKTPKLLRRITLHQLMQLKEISSSAGNAYNIIYSISNLTPVPLVYTVLKNFFGKRIGYVVKIYIVSAIAKEIYEGDKNV